MLLCGSILGAVEIGLAPLVIVGRDGEVSSDSGEAPSPCA